LGAVADGVAAFTSSARAIGANAIANNAPISMARRSFTRLILHSLAGIEAFGGPASRPIGPERSLNRN
jgi:hypothetical protein